MRTEESYSVESFIRSAPSNNLNYESMSFIEKFSSVTMVTHNILTDYIDELYDLSVTVNLSDEEYNRYVYKPKLLAYDLYGSGELYFVILALNDICNVKEFNFRKLRMLKVEDLEQFLSSIYNSERYVLNLNRSKNE